jgi:hypothetical protein
MISYTTSCIPTISYTMYSIRCRIRCSIRCRYFLNMSEWLQISRTLSPAPSIAFHLCLKKFAALFWAWITDLWRGLCPDNTCNTDPRPYPERQCACVLGPSCARTTSITPCQPIQARSVRGEALLDHTHSGFQRVCAAIARATPPPPAPGVATKIVLQHQDWCCEAVWHTQRRSARLAGQEAMPVDHNQGRFLGC